MTCSDYVSSAIANGGQIQYHAIRPDAWSTLSRYIIENRPGDVTARELNLLLIAVVTSKTGHAAVSGDKELTLAGDQFLHLLRTTSKAEEESARLYQGDTKGYPMYLGRVSKIIMRFYGQDDTKKEPADAPS